MEDSVKVKVKHRNYFVTAIK